MPARKKQQRPQSAPARKRAPAGYRTIHVPTEETKRALRAIERGEGVIETSGDEFLRMCGLEPYAGDQV